MVRLARPSVEHEEKFLQMMADYRNHNEHTFDSDYFTKGFNFQQYIKDIDELSKGIGLPEGYVPTTEWWLINNEDGIVGTVRLRHWLSDRNRQEGGHIGYDISPRFRGRGFGSKILELALEKARELSLSEVLLTCDFDNVASIKVIERNGGKFENEIVSEDTQKRVFRYWISL